MVKILGLLGVFLGMGHMFWHGPTLNGIGLLCFANSIMLLSLIFKNTPADAKDSPQAKQDVA